MTDTEEAQSATTTSATSIATPTDKDAAKSKMLQLLP